ncbi:MAG: hypothetical protein ACKO6N_12945 [Myxococcota bacterium]
MSSSATLNPLLQLVEHVAQSRPFKADVLSRLTGVNLEPEPVEENPFFTFYAGGPSPDGLLQHVEVRVPNGKGNRIDGKVILIVSPAAQLSARTLREHFGHPWNFSVPRVDAEVQQAHGLMWRLQWGMIRCGYKPDEGDRVSSIIFDADR